MGPGNEEMAQVPEHLGRRHDIHAPADVKQVPRSLICAAAEHVGVGCGGDARRYVLRAHSYRSKRRIILRDDVLASFCWCRACESTLDPGSQVVPPCTRRLWCLTTSNQLYNFDFIVIEAAAQSCGIYCPQEIRI